MLLRLYVSIMSILTGCRHLRSGTFYANNRAVLYQFALTSTCLDDTFEPARRIWDAQNQQGSSEVIGRGDYSRLATGGSEAKHLIVSAGVSFFSSSRLSCHLILIFLMQVTVLHAPVAGLALTVLVGDWAIACLPRTYRMATSLQLHSRTHIAHETLEPYQIITRRRVTAITDMECGHAKQGNSM